MLTAIVPLDLNRRPKDLIRKIKYLSNLAERNEFKVFFGHNDRGSKYDLYVKKFVEKFKFIKIKSKCFSGIDINAAQLRNLAFEFVTTEYIVLLDADIYLEISLLNHYKNKIARHEKPFYIIPCLYLTKYGTRKLTLGAVSAQELKENYFNFSRREFLHLASPSSIVILRSDAYRAIGGFCTRYHGHGYEDFDFLIKLAEHYSLLDVRSDFMDERYSRSPLFAVGFKRYLGELCLDVLLDKTMLLHLYHKKDSRDSYYVSRKSNYNIFLERCLSINKKSNSNTTSDSTLINKFVSLCNANGKNIHDYSIFFENKPGHIDRYDSLIKKIKFLLSA